jgi:hypothetical protein
MRVADATGSESEGFRVEGLQSRAARPVLESERECVRSDGLDGLDEHRARSQGHARWGRVGFGFRIRGP